MSISVYQHTYAQMSISVYQHTYAHLMTSRELLTISYWLSITESVTIADIWTKFYTELKHHAINMTECSKCTRLVNPRWWRPPPWILKNVNNFELDRAICGEIWWANASRPCVDNTWPKLETWTFLRDVIVVMNKNCAFLFLSELLPISMNFNNFW